MDKEKHVTTTCHSGGNKRTWHLCFYSVTHIIIYFWGDIMERLIKFNDESKRNNVYLSIKRGNSVEYKKYLFENFVYYVYTDSIIREGICLSNIDFAIKTAMSINPSIMELQVSFNTDYLIQRVCEEVELLWLCILMLLLNLQNIT